MNKILAIEDREACREDIAASLKNEVKSGKYELIFASDGNEGLKAIDKEKPDLILLDLIMSAPDGFEILKQIHAKKRTTRIIVITAYASRENLVKIFNTGRINSFVCKPYNKEELNNLVEQVLLESTLYQATRKGKRKTGELSSEVILDNVLNKFPSEEQTQLVGEIIEYLPVNRLNSLSRSLK